MDTLNQTSIPEPSAAERQAAQEEEELERAIQVCLPTSAI